MAKVLLKKSSVSSNAPGVDDLAYGEVAINYADGRLYYKNSSNEIKNFVDSDLVAGYISAVEDIKVNIAGDTMTGVLNMGGNKITSLATPTADSDAATKKYVDDAIGSPLTIEDVNDAAIALAIALG